MSSVSGIVVFVLFCIYLPLFQSSKELCLVFSSLLW